MNSVYTLTDPNLVNEINYNTSKIESTVSNNEVNFKDLDFAEIQIDMNSGLMIGSDPEVKELYTRLLSKSIEDRIKLVHVRTFDNTDQFSKTGGVTIAVGREHGTHRYAKISTAVCSHNQIFCKKAGNLLALLNYYSGKHITIYVGTNKPTEIARSMFDYLK